MVMNPMVETVEGRIPAPARMQKNLVNNGINYQPQLVSRISEPSTEVKTSLGGGFKYCLFHPYLGK